jgi:formate hydrogenlyase transcriptional activator
MQTLVKWGWPGNARELENFIERSVILSSGPALHAPPAELQAADRVSSPDKPVDNNLEIAEREHILRVLRECKGVMAALVEPLNGLD